MPIVMNPHARHLVKRSSSQKITIGLGIALNVIGVIGVIAPGMLHLHMSVANNSIHILSGVIALWCGLSDVKKSISFCLWFGAIFGLVGIIGFMLGEPGYPSVGYREADQYLFRVLPNVLEFGSIDHFAHMVVAALCLLTAYTFRRDKDYRRGKVSEGPVRNDMLES